MQQGGQQQTFEELLRQAVGTGNVQNIDTVFNNNPVDSEAVKRVYTDTWNAFVQNPGDIQIINALYNRVDKKTAVGLASQGIIDVTLEVGDGVTFQELLNGRQFAATQAHDLANDGDLGDDIADANAQVQQQNQPLLQAQAEAAQRRRVVSIEHGALPSVMPVQQPQPVVNQQDVQSQVPLAGRPNVPDPAVALVGEIQKLRTRENEFLGQLDPDKRTINERKTDISNRLLKSMSPDLLPFNATGVDAYTAMINKKADAIFDKFYKADGSFKDGVTNKDIVEKVEAAINEERSQILLQAYVSKYSLRALNVRDPDTKNSISEKYMEDAMASFESGNISADDVRNAVTFEYRRSKWFYSTFKELGVEEGFRQLGSSTYRFLSAPLILGRISGNMSDNISDYMSKNKAKSAAIGVLVFVAFCVLFNALAIAIIFGGGALLTIGAAKGVSMIYSKPEVPPEKKGFKDEYKEFVKDKQGLDIKILGLPAPKMAEALMANDQVISNYLNDKGLMAKVLGNKEVTDKLSPPDLKVKLKEFFDKNPPETQIKTMLTGNPELQAIVRGEPSLMINPTVVQVLQQLPPPQVQPQGQALPQQQPPVVVQQPVPQQPVQPNLVPQNVVNDLQGGLGQQGQPPVGPGNGVLNPGVGQQANPNPNQGRGVS